MKLFSFCIIYVMSLLSCCGQNTHVIEPSIMEVSYHTKYYNSYDDFALRIGKNISEYFSYHTLRFDSLASNPETALAMINEKIETAKNHNEVSKQKVESPGHGDYLYRNLEAGKTITYTQVWDSYYRIIEDIPTQKWKIYEDSTREIIGFVCTMATTHFRGREWKVWFSEEIPLPLGPWKFGGLPGLILAAHSDNFLDITASNIKKDQLTPIKFYNFWDKKFGDIDRKAYLKMVANPNIYPKNITIIPKMEIE
jgi:GLPGLI family protein